MHLTIDRYKLKLHAIFTNVYYYRRFEMTDFIMSFNHIDAYGSKSNKKVYFTGYAGLDVGLDTVQALADADSWLEEYEDVTKTSITDVNFSVLNLDIASLLPGWDAVRKLTALAGADVSERADYSVSTIPLAPGTQAKANLSVVAPVDGLFVNAATSRILDIASVLLGPLIAQYAQTPGGNAKLSDGQDILVTGGVNSNGILSGAFNTRKTSGPRS